MIGVTRPTKQIIRLLPKRRMIYRTIPSHRRIRLRHTELMIEENKALSAILAMRKSWIRFVSVVLRIKTKGLWRFAVLPSGQYARTWAEYVKQTFEISDSRIRQYQLAEPVAQLVASVTNVTPSEWTIRRVRSIADHYTEHEQATILVMAIRHAKRHDLPSVNGLGINSAMEVMEQIQVTGGFVDIGDGQMTAIDMAVDRAYEERKARQALHIADEWRTVETVIHPTAEAGVYLVRLGDVIAPADGSLQVRILYKNTKSNGRK